MSQLENGGIENVSYFGKKEARMTLQPSSNHNNHSHTGIGNTRTYARRAQHGYFLTNKKASMYSNTVQCKSVQPCVSHKGQALGSSVEMVLCIMLRLCRAPVCMRVQQNRNKKNCTEHAASKRKRRGLANPSWTFPLAGDHSQWRSRGPRDY